MTWKPPRTAVALTAAAVLLSSCGRPQPIVDYGPSPSPPASRPPSGGAAFFTALRPGPAADLKEQPRTLAAAYAASTAVVEADVVGVRPGEAYGEPAMGDILVDLRPARVLRGALRPELPTVTVEFFHYGHVQPDAAVRTMRKDLPARGVWLLRWQGQPSEHRKPGAQPLSPAEDVTLYRTVHPNCGVFVQGASHVEAPSSQDTGRPRDAQAEAERFATLPELADHAVRA
ncbi:hypothetical protein [Actinoplanes utahensis]|uniref:Lipoprotein n=1 Tax=Actinoplanes utahensis TaxID=1869 RepID=A0A0A6X3J7_ACTUT|nr:hypothetical protein [Actinoplanes utahensis]KHD74682.1 hypothetical protein MB27_27170 [Actinoplanes utahensis]GIF34444.1 hypothetical protein Aut01nite_74300 [Actinoplanes utahensis]